MTLSITHSATTTPMNLHLRTPLFHVGRHALILFAMGATALVASAANASNALRGATVTDSCLACTADKFGAPGAVVDGDHATMRNLGGGAPGSFTITTARPVSLDKLVLLPAMTPGGAVSFEIQTSKDASGTAGTWVSHGGALSRPWADRVPVEVAMNPDTSDVRAVKVIIHQSPSWVALYEIEGESGVSKWIYALVIFAALIAGGLLYRQYRRRQRVASP